MVSLILSIDSLLVGFSAIIVIMIICALILLLPIYISQCLYKLVKIHIFNKRALTEIKYEELNDELSCPICLSNYT